MDIQLQSAERPDIAEEGDSVMEQKSVGLFDVEDTKIIPHEGLKEDKLEEKAANPSEDDSLNKNLNVREIHETSPFRQVVKGYLINKLNKKVGSSHILSGLTEKLVKKLEDKDYCQSVSVHNSESELSLSSLRIKDTPTEVISSSVSCELKSVVANDIILSEGLNIEDAIECVEEPKSSASDSDIGISIPRKAEFRSNSISLPSSPAHRFTKRASSISYSLEDTESPQKHSCSSNASVLSENNIHESENSNVQDEIELQDLKGESSYPSNEESTNSEFSYPHNIYTGEKEDLPKFKTVLMLQTVSLLHNLKNLFASLSLSHYFLMASVVIHNIGIISPYLSFIFDGLIIAYVCYAYICVLIQKPSLNKTSSFPFVDPHLENASIQVQKVNKSVKGSVKILKGEYDPEMTKYHSTDLVDISIENCCLKLHSKKKSKDVSAKTESFKFYDLIGASVSIVPKDLSRRRIWNKKYPICIMFSSTFKEPTTSDDNTDPDTLATDYLSTFHDEDINTERKSLYFFALTDREKETLFWAILRNTEDSNNVKQNEQTCDTSPKRDFSSMSYTSLLQMNSEDSLSPSKELDEDENSTVEKTTTDLEFENYMNKLFENFERMNRFTSRARSFEDLSNLKEEISKPSDTFISKDDSFLSSISRKYSVDWLNVVLGRLFYDFLTQKHWSEYVKTKIQRKLDKIEMPSFIESLEVSDIFMGTSLPEIHTVSSPVVDINGVWFDFDFNYCGSFQMTLKTKLKITKAKQLPGSESVDSGIDSKQSVPLAASSESDEDEDSETKLTSAKKKRLINKIEKWISHKHFQTVAQSRFVKRYVGDLSNMPLALTVELNTLHGILTINIPPVPTDRVWYGFRKDPVLSLNAYPKVGTREINLSAIVQMIEKKLIQEFKKAIVMPNMDDLLIPIMHSPIYGF